MKTLAFLVFAAVLVLGTTAWPLSAKFDQFHRYAKEYNKKYDSYAIELYRFAIYLKNLVEIEELNILDEGTAVYGETMFTDMTKSEMREYLGLVIPKDFKYNYVQNFTNEHQYKPRTDTPDIWNWEQQGAVTPVKNQGSCGSCWTFSTAGNVEGLWYLKHKELINFSMQQLIDCDKSNFGCNGGWPYNAIDWLAKNGGMETLADYPQRANYTGPCQFDEKKAKAQIQGYLNITHDENVIKDALYEKGPLSILLDFTGLFHYKSGVASPLLCSTWPDHALVLVGYGTKQEDYWLIKNSWGPQWGINGYLMLKRGAKKCGINLWATTAILKN